MVVLAMPFIAAFCFPICAFFLRSRIQSRIIHCIYFSCLCLLIQEQFPTLFFFLLFSFMPLFSGDLWWCMWRREVILHLILRCFYWKVAICMCMFIYTYCNIYHYMSLLWQNIIDGLEYTGVYYTILVTFRKFKFLTK